MASANEHKVTIGSAPGELVACAHMFVLKNCFLALCDSYYLTGVAQHGERPSLMLLVLQSLQCSFIKRIVGI
jgi:hypothetical protein